MVSSGKRILVRGYHREGKGIPLGGARGGGGPGWETGEEWVVPDSGVNIITDRGWEVVLRRCIRAVEEIL